MTYNQKIPPFKWFILENFPYIEEDFDALTNWQLFCKLGKEMNKIIEKTNLTGEQVENLTNAFNTLKEYIDNYFENLDVQDEIDNKLDEMAESGQLTDIIAQYLQLAGVLAYDTKTAMKQAQNLADGSITKTLGNTNYKDGQGAFFKVRQIQNTDVVDDNNIVALHDTNLVAEKIIEKSEENYIFVSDSYGAGYTWDTDHYIYLDKGWCDYTKDAMSIPDSNYHKFCESGAGFKHVGNYGHTFIQLIQNGASSITNKNAITKIIVCGGGNDAFSLRDEQTTVSELNTLTQQFYNYCKTTFPNAKVYFGMITNFKAQTESGVTNRINLQSILYVYKYTCRFGGIYLNGVENIMHNYDDMFGTDNVHPDVNGYKLLGEYIAQAIQNGSISYKLPYKRATIDFESFVNTNTTTLALDNCLNDDNTTISFNECNITFSTPQTYGGSSPERKIIKIGNVEMPYFRGDYLQSAQIPTRFYYMDEGTNAYSGFGYLTINTAGQIWIDTSTVTSNPAAFHTPTNVSFIHLYGGKVEVPTMYS